MYIYILESLFLTCRTTVFVCKITILDGVDPLSSSATAC